MKFHNRLEAGYQLADKLGKYIYENVIILALPKGGIITAFPTIQRYNYKWDLLMTGKIGISFNKEIYLGSVASDGTYFLDEYMLDQETSKEALKKEIEWEIEKTKRKMRKFRHTENMPDVCNKTVILIDDGMSTGYTMLAAVNCVRKKGAKKVIVAIPVSPSITLYILKSYVDEIICLQIPEPFYSIGTYYNNFAEIDDDEINDLINKLKKN